MTDTATSIHIKPFLGLLDYEAGLAAQNSALAEIAKDGADAVLLGLEHEPVVTLGVRGRLLDDIQLPLEQMHSKGFEVHATGRGGQATLHSPGQLVIYPCVNLRAFGLGARKYVDLVQTTTATWLKDLGVPVTASAAEPGLFIEGAKVAAFGFKIERGLTSHGLAVNVANDLEHFGLIRTCGVSRQRVTRLRDLGVSSDLETLYSRWALLFRANLQQERRPDRPKLDAACALTLV